MARYIDADAFEAFGYEVNGGSYDFKDGFDEGVQFVLECIDNVPTADVRENVKGEWIERTNPNLGKCLRDSIECSVCGCYFCEHDLVRRSFCPNCGADMRGDKK